MKQPDPWCAYPLFSKREATQLLTLIEETPQVRTAPNSMNKYGTLIGGRLAPVMRMLQDAVVERFAAQHSIFLKQQPYAFTVDYTPTTQRSLATHIDSSAVTLNICLGRTFKGGDLLFPDHDVRIPQYPGQAILHLGNMAHRALALTAGSRTNLVLWCRARKGAFK